MVLQNIWRRVVGIVLMNIFISIVFLTTSGWKISSQLFTAIWSLMGQCKIFIGWQSQFVGNFLINISQSNVFLTKNACTISSKLSKHLARLKIITCLLPKIAVPGLFVCALGLVFVWISAFAHSNLGKCYCYLGSVRLFGKIRYLDTLIDAVANAVASKDVCWDPSSQDSQISKAHWVSNVEIQICFIHCLGSVGYFHIFTTYFDNSQAIFYCQHF